MKIPFSIILLFFLTSLFSQEKIENLTSITLSKPYYQTTDGHCNPFVSPESANIISEKIIDCDDLVLKLIEIQKKKKTWKSQESTCMKGWIGGAEIENMIVYQFNKLIDTLYFTHHKRTILFDYANEKDYFDEKNEIIAVLFKSKSLKNFYGNNALQLRGKIYDHAVYDSIAVENLKINNKDFYGLNQQQVNSIVVGFTGLQTEKDLYDNRETRKYSKPNQESYNTYFFTNESPIDKIEAQPIVEKGNQFPDEEIFNINGITFNDSEEKLIQLFPLSAQYINEIKKYFKDENGDYTITIQLEDKKGRINFILNNEKITKIIVDFYYPKKL